MLPVEVDGLRVQQRTDQVRRFDEPRHPCCPGIEGNAGGVVFGPPVSGAQSQFEAAFGEGCHTGRLSSGVHGMAKVVVEHQCAGVQSLRGHRRGGRACERRNRRHQVVREGQHVEPGGLDSLREGAHLGARAGQRCRQPET
ncbi:Uncharacterised protein [Mycobacterium tuberculosis]|uniref:Uncharacterized protein n=1 Tax=Mycobacterium tuberculosis TaxID=1773 RepID=A0A655JL34_MYCTX|nr:Uncharacterised protein [Mycobacterium tuberculosis]COX12455.1 Uncharacterised protein [Mycobacterium tuberculosis]